METWVQVLIRSVLIFALLLTAVRFMGKRNISRITPFHAVSYIVIAVLAALVSANAIINTVLGFISLGVWVIGTIALEYLALKSKWVHDLVYGKETVLIKHGRIMEQSLLKARLTGDELLRALRAKNAFSLADVEFAVLETTGDISVFMKSDKNPVTARDLEIKNAPLTEPQTVILDGNILNEPLTSLGLNREWLGVQLEKLGISLDNIFIAQVDSSGELYVDLFDDSIQNPQPKVKEMLYASLEKSQADLAAFALQTQNENAKGMYNKNAEKLEDLLKILKPHLLK
ncbi:MAG: hypothetical protein APF77_20805 [Clostridia bacterium BRH_c25]|nr:MAG: hypothetical protein APF77_20805 [Clostridia bacterium BRH_c25]